MFDLLKSLITEASFDNLFVIAGVLFLGLAVVGKFSTTMGELEPGKNRQGGDLVNFESAGATACADSCLKDVRCKSMTFVQHPGQSAGICWLKGSVPPLSDAQGMVSAVKRFD